MLLIRSVHKLLSVLFPANSSNDLVLLIIGALAAFLLSYLLTFGIIALCFKMGWLDRPAARRVHKNPVPRLGGVGIFLAFAIASLIFYVPGEGKQQKVFGGAHPSELVIYFLFLLAALLIVAVHAYDDVKGLKPLPKLLAQTAAVVIILAPGRTIFHGVLLYTFSNPFYPTYGPSNIHLFLDRPEISFYALPAVIFTWFWIVGMTNTVNLIDGLDGLATGVVAITGLFIAVISWTLHQYSIAILAGIFTGAVLGFLPHNWNPAKVFMGDSGSQFLGLGLAVLSIMGGAKVALALMVLGIPILDVAVVMINRVRRGQHPLHYDKTHLHYRLLATGLSVKQICYVFYTFTVVFGILALNLSRIYKLLGISLVGITMAVLIIWIDYRQRQRGTPMKLGGVDLQTGEEEKRETEGAVEQRNTPSEYETQKATENTDSNVPEPDSTAESPRTQLPL